MDKIQPGTKIWFNRSDDTIQKDTVREIIWQETLGTQGLPGGGPFRGVAFILTDHSWCWAEDMIGLVR